MSAEQLLNLVEEAIKNRPVSPAKKFWLCYKDGAFYCLPIAPAPSDLHLLGTYSTKELDEGFSARQWGKLLTALAKIKEEKTP